MKITKEKLNQIIQEELKAVNESDDNWIQDAEKDIEKRGTEGVCTGDKFGSDSCPPGSKRYNLAKTFRKMARDRKDESLLTSESLSMIIEEIIEEKIK